MKKMIAFIAVMAILVAGGIYVANKNMQTPKQERTTEREIYDHYKQAAELAENATDPEMKKALLKQASIWRYAWGKYYEENALYDDAKSHYRVALQHDPDNTVAKKALKELQPE